MTGERGDRRSREPVEERLQRREPDPGGHGDGAHPPDVGEVEGRTEGEPERQSASCPHAVHDGEEAGDGHRQQHRPGDRLEGEREHEARDDGEGQAEHVLTLPAGP
jgi:hypothetical protein